MHVNALINNVCKCINECKKPSFFTEPSTYNSCCWDSTLCPPVVVIDLRIKLQSFDKHCGWKCTKTCMYSTCSEHIVFLLPPRKMDDFINQRSTYVFTQTGLFIWMNEDTRHSRHSSVKSMGPTWVHTHNVLYTGMDTSLSLYIYRER